MGKQKLILPFGAFSPWFAVIRCLEARLHRALQRVGGDEASGSGRSTGLRGGCVSSNLRHADDTTLMAESEEKRAS